MPWRPALNRADRRHARECTTDDLQRHLRVDDRALLLVHGDLDLHRRLRGHLPPQRPDRPGQGRLDRPDLRHPVHRRPDLHHRPAEGDRPGRPAHGAGGCREQGRRGGLAGRRAGQAPAAQGRRARSPPRSSRSSSRRRSPAERPAPGRGSGSGRCPGRRSSVTRRSAANRRAPPSWTATPTIRPRRLAAIRWKSTSTWQPPPASGVTR